MDITFDSFGNKIDLPQDAKHKIQLQLKPSAVLLLQNESET